MSEPQDEIRKLEADVSWLEQMIGGLESNINDYYVARLDKLSMARLIAQRAEWNPDQRPLLDAYVHDIEEIDKGIAILQRLRDTYSGRAKANIRRIKLLSRPKKQPKKSRNEDYIPYEVGSPPKRCENARREAWDHTPWKDMKSEPVVTTLPVPVTESEPVDSGSDHVLVGDIDRRAMTMLSWSPIGVRRHRSRRYEGYSQRWR